MYEQLRFRTTDFDIDIDSHWTNKRSHTRLCPQKVLSERRTKMVTFFWI